MLAIINTILKMELGKTAKLVLVTMASNPEKKYWMIKEFLDYIGGDAKTIRFCINDLVTQCLVLREGKTDTQAFFYAINLHEIDRYASCDENDDELIENELIRLSRQAQRHHPKYNSLSRRTKKP